MPMEVLLRCTEPHATDTGPQMNDFVWEGPPAAKACSKCGNTFELVPLTRVFFIVEDRSGPIVGSKGRRYIVPSQPEKKAFIPHVEACTSVWQAVNNPACMRTKEYKAIRDREQMQQYYATGGITVPDNFIEQEATPQKA